MTMPTTDTPALTGDNLRWLLGQLESPNRSVGIRYFTDALALDLHKGMLAHNPPLIAPDEYGLFYLTEAGKAAWQAGRAGKK